MESQTPKCYLCYADFDSGIHTPRIIPVCGHTLCSLCIKNTLDQMDKTNFDFLCPIEKNTFKIKDKDLGAFPINVTLLGIMEKDRSAQIENSQNNQKEMPSMCPLHDKPFELACIEDKQYICFECAVFGAHNGHTIKKFPDLNKMLDEKVQQLEQLIKRIEKQSEGATGGMDMAIEAKRQELIDKVSVKFNELVSMILSRKIDVLKEISDYFDDVKSNLYSTGDKSSNEDLMTWKNKAKGKIESWKQNKKNWLDPINFAILEEDLGKVLPVYNSWVFKFKEECKKNAEVKLEKIDAVFDYNFFENYQQVCTLQFDGKMLSSCGDSKITIKQFETKNSNFQKRLKRDKSRSPDDNRRTTSEVGPALSYEFRSRNSENRKRTPSPSKNENESIKEEEHFERKVSLSQDFLRASADLSLVGIKMDWETKGGIMISASVEVADKISEKSFVTLSSILAKFPFVVNLQLDFSSLGSKLTDKCVYHLSEAIAKLISLNQLEVSMNYASKITDITLHNLGIAIIKLQNLSTLSYMMQGCPKLTDYGLKQLSNSLKKNKRIKFLKICFEGCTKVGDEGVSDLVTSISVLTSLEKIHLLFGLCSKIEDSSLSSLATTISTLPALKVIILNFGNCSMIKDGGATTLCLSFIHHSSTLKHLEINFSDCKRLTDNTANILGQSLARLTQIEQLEVYLSRCSKITGTGISTIHNALPKLTNLKNIRLFLKDCGKIMPNLIDDIKRTIEFIPESSLFI